MITPHSMSEQLLYTTVMIEDVTDPDNTGIGTGFFYNISLGEKKQVPCIITNKHVVENTQKTILRLHEGKEAKGQNQPTGKALVFNISKFETYIVLHPDKDIDICAIIAAGIIDHAMSGGNKVFYRSLNNGDIPDEDQLSRLFAIEDIVLAGYPTGLWDTKNNFPIFRRGVTANHPAVDYCGHPIGVIDAACFPGSSGSPVMIVNEGSYQDKTGMKVGINRFHLLGVLYGGPILTQEGEIIVKDIPMSRVEVPTIDTPINLGYYIKAKEILTLERHILKLLDDKGLL